MPWSINAFAALAGERVLNDRDYQQATLRWLAREGQRLYQALAEIDGITVYPGRANYEKAEHITDTANLTKKLSEFEEEFRNSMIKASFNFEAINILPFVTIIGKTKKN
mgnify:CR=1 FL=1